MGYIYLVQLREFVRLDEPTFKFGKTEQAPEKRMGGYPKGSQIEMYMKVEDCTQVENLILLKFKELYTQKLEYGREYFSGDPQSMIETIFEIAKECNGHRSRHIKQHPRDNATVRAIIPFKLAHKFTVSGSDGDTDNICVFCAEMCVGRSSCSGRYNVMQGSFRNKNLKTEKRIFKGLGGKEHVTIDICIDLFYICDICIEGKASPMVEKNNATVWFEDCGIFDCDNHSRMND